MRIGSNLQILTFHILQGAKDRHRHLDIIIMSDYKHLDLSNARCSISHIGKRTPALQQPSMVDRSNVLATQSVRGGGGGGGGGRGREK